jgi:hypothetical protein
MAAWTWRLDLGTGSSRSFRVAGAFLCAGSSLSIIGARQPGASSKSDHLVLKTGEAVIGPVFANETVCLS